MSRRLGLALLWLIVAVPSARAELPALPLASLDTKSFSDWTRLPDPNRYFLHAPDRDSLLIFYVRPEKNGQQVLDEMVARMGKDWIDTGTRKGKVKRVAYSTGRVAYKGAEDQTVMTSWDCDKIAVLGVAVGNKVSVETLIGRLQNFRCIKRGEKPALAGAAE